MLFKPSRALDIGTAPGHIQPVGAASPNASGITSRKEVTSPPPFAAKRRAILPRMCAIYLDPGCYTHGHDHLICLKMQQRPSGRFLLALTRRLSGGKTWRLGEARHRRHK